MESNGSPTSYVEVAGRFAGPLRPLLADFLWLRAIDSQDNRRYYEAYTLSCMILRLEPRYTPVWVFTGWNLAYNISWDQVHPEDRFRWIMSGIELMEEGVRRNPDSLDVRGQLGHIYAHRLSPAGGDPYQHYFEEYISPPADWTAALGLAYTGERVFFDDGSELRLYGGAVEAGTIRLGGYPPKDSRRLPAPYAVFWRPDTTNALPPALARLADGANLWEESSRIPVAFPEALRGARAWWRSASQCRDGTTLELAAPGKLWVGFPPDRFECLRRAVDAFEGGRKRVKLSSLGMDGLNFGRELAHTYESLGEFEEAEQVWLELLSGVEMRFRWGLEKGVENFYARVLKFHGADAENAAMWEEKRKAARAEMKLLGTEQAPADHERGEHR